MLAVAVVVQEMAALVAQAVVAAVVLALLLMTLTEVLAQPTLAAAVVVHLNKHHL